MALACFDIVQALQGPRETTIAKLIKEYSFEKLGLLESLRSLQSIFDQWGVILEPKIGTGGLNDTRVLRAKKQVNLRELVINDIGSGEGSQLEFKQTLVLDIKKHIFGKKPISECYSEDVVASSMKTVAAFLNSGGGVLLLGVCDDGKPYSLENEFEIACPKENRSIDGWELRFRGLIEKYFTNGSSLQPYIDINFVKIDECLVSRVVVGSRGRLSFLRREGFEYLYIRVGNRTQSVTLSQLEDFFTLTRR